ncbi:aldehyde dehydrogenase family protein [Streptomyces sp. NBC_00335]|uniref:aldehyde dehydrogenase family protein n=1 Tax=unclassified Streptomyces TaxID=2593676 RepID=UPI002254882C|nr:MULTISPECIES: aldehyde dehydrogenase family protein [unclassified Streptomyces]MCX5410218.1 aldehyde dehydrogenase family protein [Streptomyces sp. NBC_00086]
MADPAFTSRTVGSVRSHTAAEVDSAVAAASTAAPGWSGTSAVARAAALARIADGLEAAAAELSELLARESGKPLADCRGEVGYACAVLRWYAAEAPRLLAPHVVDDTRGRLERRYRPFGVVAALTPWNAPVILTAVKLAPALAAGNTVVVKPSPLAPLAVSAFLEGAARELPEGVVRVCHGHAEVALRLAGHGEVGKLSFTGGAVAGRAVGAAAAAALTPTTMELGGNDAAVLLDDAPLTEADMDRLVMASFATAGQVCMAAKRVYVPRARLGQFVERYVAAAARVLRLGDPLAPGTTVGPVISARAAVRVRGLIRDARKRGGSAVELGTVQPGLDVEGGHFVRPTLLLGLREDAPLVCEEQFGPALPVLAYEGVDELVERVNAGPYGLAASVWSADETRAFELAARLDAGFRFVNTHNRTGMALRAAFGGVKGSGHGREYGAEGLMEYVQPVLSHAPAAFRAGGAGMAPGAYPGGGPGT